MSRRPTATFRQSLTGWLWVAPTLLFLVLFVYGPALANIRYSLFSFSAMSQSKTFVGLANYSQLFGDPLFITALTNNIAYAVISVIFQVAFALTLAAVLEAKIFPSFAANSFRTMLFLPSILPVVVVGLIWQLLLAPTMGLIDQALWEMGLGEWSRAWLGDPDTAIFTVIMVSQWQWTGYIMALFMVAIRAIPRDLYEAMELEGASGARIFFNLTVPGARETILIVTIITILGSLKVFDIVWVMTAGGPNHSSEVLGTLMYRAAFRDDTIGYSSSIATVIFFIALTIGVVQIKLQKDH
ncbi:carbohydrate ABC transporter permease [Notoacmeibacter ruber]|uniref:Sugar ABC transporter permease n=1 Tax=Notoacmeibacter ruber TaxID=2670375 RepID=A0A3L7J8D5_9HYPH|nr:sugar ABC transporter permease [Notoacmeibacter ruber]RLQ86997.1 sugar ABC transporter permease [Notoacmeibacter ruber]